MLSCPKINSADRPKNTSKNTDLMAEFFAFYFRFDVKTKIVSIKDSGPEIPDIGLHLSRYQKQHFPMTRRLLIEDPFEAGRFLTTSVSGHDILLQELARASEIVDRGEEDFSFRMGRTPPRGEEEQMEAGETEDDGKLAEAPGVVNTGYLHRVPQSVGCDPSAASEERKKSDKEEEREKSDKRIDPRVLAVFSPWMPREGEREERDAQHAHPPVSEARDASGAGGVWSRDQQSRAAPGHRQHSSATPDAGKLLHDAVPRAVASIRKRVRSRRADSLTLTSPGDPRSRAGSSSHGHH